MSDSSDVTARRIADNAAVQAGVLATKATVLAEEAVDRARFFAHKATVLADEAAAQARVIADEAAARARVLADEAAQARVIADKAIQARVVCHNMMVHAFRNLAIKASGSFFDFAVDVDVKKSKDVKQVTDLLNSICTNLETVVKDAKHFCLGPHASLESIGMQYSLLTTLLPDNIMQSEYRVIHLTAFKNTFKAMCEFGQVHTVVPK
jgi:hypothetical protein